MLRSIRRLLYAISPPKPHLPSLLLFAMLAVYSFISWLLFEKVFQAASIIVDEEFHYVQGLDYCRLKYDKWHPKITTFPGLYILSSLIVGPLKKCSRYYLRAVPFGFSILNVYLVSRVIRGDLYERRWKNALNTLGVVLLPPLYFFSFFYYTDVPSLTTVLAMFYMYQKRNHFMASIFGMCSVLMRQTNVVWVALFAACYTFKTLNNVAKKSSTGAVRLRDFKEMLLIDNGKLLNALCKARLQFWLNLFSYVAILFSFVYFVVLNDGIVVGDKNAHEASFHIPQIFYFSLFCLFFAWPHFLDELPRFVRSLNRTIFTFIVLTLLCIVIVQLNTLVHPYMLADNRHYIFYIWNRFYERYWWFKYAMCPVYVFSMFVICKKLYNERDVTFLFFFVICTFLVLTTQKLVELRYFFVPYVLFRMKFRHSRTILLVLEIATHLVVNAICFYLFFTKTIYWKEYKYPQRLIW